MTASPQSEERLRLRSVTFREDEALVFEFEGVNTADRTFVATLSVAGGIPLINFDDEFNRLFMGVPCLSTNVEYPGLASSLWAARRERLPAGDTWLREFQDCVDRVAMSRTDSPPDDV